MNAHTPRFGRGAAVSIADEAGRKPRQALRRTYSPATARPSTARPSLPACARCLPYGGYPHG